MKDRLNKSATIASKIHFLKEIVFYKVYYLGQKSLLELREDIMLVISSLSRGSRNIVQLVSFERCLKNVYVDILFFFVLSKKLLKVLAIS